jgi:hypothetical protein
MMRNHAIAIVLLMATAAPATAQLTPEQARAKTDNAPVTVALPDGTWRGRLVDIDAESVTILPPGGVPKTLPLADILRVDARKPDPIGNGALIGAAAGVLYCIVLCRNGAWMLMEGSAGLVIGSVIDAQIHGTVSLYRRPERDMPKRSSGLFFTVAF